MHRAAVKCAVENEQVQDVIDKLKDGFVNDLEDMEEMTD